jgi:hypothetical protein
VQPNDIPANPRQFRADLGKFGAPLKPGYIAPLHQLKNIARAIAVEHPHIKLPASEGINIPKKCRAVAAAEKRYPGPPALAGFRATVPAGKLFGNTKASLGIVALTGLAEKLTCLNPEPAVARVGIKLIFDTPQGVNVAAAVKT